MSTTPNEYVKGSYASDVFLLEGSLAQEVYAGHRDDILSLEDGDDFARGGGGSDIMVASSGDNTFYGGAGHDILMGGDGNNILYGEKGNDDLYDFYGGDVLDGGEGDDIYHIVGGKSDSGTDFFRVIIP